MFQQCGEFLLGLSGSHVLVSQMLEVCFLRHLLSEFQSGGIVFTHFLEDEGVGLIVIGSSGLSAVLPSCPFPVVAGQLEVRNSGFCHSLVDWYLVQRYDEISQPPNFSCYMSSSNLSRNSPSQFSVTGKYNLVLME